MNILTDIWRTTKRGEVVEPVAKLKEKKKGEDALESSPGVRLQIGCAYEPELEAEAEVLPADLGTLK